MSFLVNSPFCFYDIGFTVDERAVEPRQPLLTITRLLSRTAEKVSVGTFEDEWWGHPLFGEQDQPNF